ncbi:MAG: hypothetical protein WBQ75_13950 [Acetobacteraceae bacterium]
MKALLVVAGVGLLACVPALHPSEYVIALGVSFAVFSVLSSGLNLVYGYTGMMSFGQVGFFGIGGYATALLVRDHGVGFLPALLVAGVIAAAVSLLLGYTALRLSRHAFSIVSLSFALLCAILARDWVGLTRGPMGIPGLSVPSIALPFGWIARLARPADFYWASLLVAVVAHVVIWCLVTSRLGRAMRAVKLNEPLAQSQGISPRGLKLMALAVSAFLAAVAGGVFVFYLSIVDPSIFDFYYPEAMLIMVIVGGAGSCFWCVLGATAVFTVLPDMLRFTPDLRMVLYGVILIVAMLAMPGGFGGWLRARQVAKWRHPGRQRALLAAGASAVVMSLLRVQGLTKRYYGLTAVDDVSYEVAAGEIVGGGDRELGLDAQRQCRDDVVAPVAAGFRGRHHRRQNAGDGMHKARNVGVVEVQHLEQGTIHHGGLFGAGAGAVPEHTRLTAGAIAGNRPFVQDLHRRIAHGGDRRLQLIDQQARRLVHRLRRHTARLPVAHEGDQLFGDRHGAVHAAHSRATSPYIHRSKLSCRCCAASKKPIASYAA